MLDVAAAAGEAVRDVAAFHEPTTPHEIREFDAWGTEALARKDLDTLLDYRRTAPALRYAHLTVDHFVPLFVALGASLESGADAATAIEGFLAGQLQALHRAALNDLFFGS